MPKFNERLAQLGQMCSRLMKVDNLSGGVISVNGIVVNTNNQVGVLNPRSFQDCAQSDIEALFKKFNDIFKRVGLFGDDQDKGVIAKDVLLRSFSSSPDYKQQLALFSEMIARNPAFIEASDNGFSEPLFVSVRGLSLGCGQNIPLDVDAFHRWINSGLLPGGHYTFMYVDTNVGVVHSIEQKVDLEDTRNQDAYVNQINDGLAKLGYTKKLKLNIVNGKCRQPDEQAFVQQHCSVAQFFTILGLRNGETAQTLPAILPPTLCVLIYLLGVVYDEPTSREVLVPMLEKIADGVLSVDCRRRTASGYGSFHHDRAGAAVSADDRQPLLKSAADDNESGAGLGDSHEQTSGCCYKLCTIS